MVGGIATQNTVYTSTDGGHTWTHQAGSSNGASYSISCVNATICYAGNGSGLIQATTNGGISWNSLITGYTTNQNLNAVACPVLNTCYAVGNYNIPDGNGGNTALTQVVITVDGGKTWQNQIYLDTANNQVINGILNSISCPSATTCFAVGSDGKGNGLILKTSDSAHTWSSYTNAAMASVGFNSVACASITTCYAITETSVFATTNGGTSWNQLTNNLILNTQSQSIKCPTALNCFIVTNTSAFSGGAIVATTDGGSSWVTQTVPINTLLFDISCPATSTCFVVGPGIVLKTVDGGSHWNINQSLDSTAGLEKIACADTLNCSALGTFGGFTTSTNDGGNSWYRQASFFYQYQSFGGQGVSCVSSSNPSSPQCFAVGDESNIVASSPNGYVYYLPALANQASGFTTYLTFQNIGNGPANIHDFSFDQAGNLIPFNYSTTYCTSLPLQGECFESNLFPPSTTGNAVIVSNQPLNIIISEATPYGASAYSISSGANDSLIMPVALNNASGGFTSQYNIFNGASIPTTATLLFYNNDGTPVSGASQTLTLGAYGSLVVDQSKSSALPSGFSGWAQLSAVPGSLLTAQVLEQNPNSNFVALTTAASQPQTTLYAPAIFNKTFGGFVTGANIVNPSASAVNVTVTYYDHTGAATTTTPFTLNAHAVQPIYQGASSGGNGLPSPNGLPTNYYGSAKVTSSGSGVVMLVNEGGGTTASGNARSGVYLALALNTSSASNSVALPVMANGGFNYTTGTTILNTSASTVNGSIQYYNTDGSVQGIPHTFTIAPNASFALYQGDPAQSLPSTFFGSAIITQSSGPTGSLVVTTNAQSSSFFYTYTEPNL
jgi:photosystem II stability/assembly factor-like uncharacterized protein